MTTIQNFSKKIKIIKKKSIVFLFFSPHILNFRRIIIDEGVLKNPWIIKKSYKLNFGSGSWQTFFSTLWCVRVDTRIAIFSPFNIYADHYIYILSDKEVPFLSKKNTLFSFCSLNIWKGCWIRRNILLTIFVQTTQTVSIVRIRNKTS